MTGRETHITLEHTTVLVASGHKPAVIARGETGSQCFPKGFYRVALTFQCVALVSRQEKWNEVSAFSHLHTWTFLIMLEFNIKNVHTKCHVRVCQMHKVQYSRKVSVSHSGMVWWWVEWQYTDHKVVCVIYWSELSSHTKAVQVVRRVSKILKPKSPKIDSCLQNMKSEIETNSLNPYTFSAVIMFFLIARLNWSWLSYGLNWQHKNIWNLHKDPIQSVGSNGQETQVCGN